MDERRHPCAVLPADEAVQKQKTSPLAGGALIITPLYKPTLFTQFQNYITKGQIKEYTLQNYYKKIHLLPAVRK